MMVGSEKEPQEQPIKYTPLEISISLEDIPDTDPCEVCRGTTRKTLVSYELPYTCEGELLVAKGDVPGYKCDECELDFYDLGASIAVLETALKVVQQAGDELIARGVEASLNAVKTHRELISA